MLLFNTGCFIVYISSLTSYFEYSTLPIPFMFLLMSIQYFHNRIPGFVTAGIIYAHENYTETNAVGRRWKIYMKHVSCNDKSCIKTIKGLSKEDKKCATHPEHLFI